MSSPRIPLAPLAQPKPPTAHPTPDTSSPALPAAVRGYFAAANAQTSAGLENCFAETAVVVDEAYEYRGLEAIRIWRDECGARYQPVVEIRAVEQGSGGVAVTGEVSGTFPGSPAALRYEFSLQRGRIQRLEVRLARNG
ncbi:nuclear transport factor 2 family protein [Azoarcus indigens]|uniref:SnoaL-like protein n=1 Tax=Azoarcus indigens TaxID=29545 RepID=A0A4R6EI71_9RHOO|nr:nuclear transport factor 2 family protein [Azoarcus indigens]NMG63595.1 nuclear transport factor 2 family protein [Azoarcus indigens]TDN57147.1 SnoaL-like protein [Azoarcus indigens]